LDHTIIAALDKHKSATFFAEMLGLPAPVSIGPFAAVQIGHGVSLDFADAGGFAVAGSDVRPQHYAFRISDAEFDAVFARIQERNMPYWADPHRAHPGEIADRGGNSRALYFEDPSGHWLEVFTPAAEQQDVA